jgi:hypothetical protein
MILLDFSFLLSAHTAKLIDILYIVNFVQSSVNTANSLILIRVSFFNFTTMMVVADVNIFLSLLLLVTDAVSFALSLLLVNIIIVYIRPVALYI